MRADPAGCKIEPSVHLLNRMQETQRGFSALEVEAAVYRGSKEYVESNKYLGTYGKVTVVVYIRHCHLKVTTVEEP